MISSKYSISTRHFRRRTLRFRSRRYYPSLIRVVLNNQHYPRFEEFWRRLPFESADQYCISGELYLHHLLPLDKATGKRVEKIMGKVGNDCIELAPFPDKYKQ